MSVTLLSPALARLDRRDAISVDVDPKAKLLPSLPLHSEQRLRRAEQRNVVISASSARSATTNHFLVSPRDAMRGTVVVGSLHRLIMFFTWPHARASFAICSLHEVRNETDAHGHIFFRGRESEAILFSRH